MSFARMALSCFRDCQLGGLWWSLSLHWGMPLGPVVAVMRMWMLRSERAGNVTSQGLAASVDAACLRGTASGTLKELLGWCCFPLLHLVFDAPIAAQNTGASAFSRCVHHEGPQGSDGVYRRVHEETRPPCWAHVQAYRVLERPSCMSRCAVASAPSALPRVLGGPPSPLAWFKVAPTSACCAAVSKHLGGTYRYAPKCRRSQEAVA